MPEPGTLPFAILARRNDHAPTSPSTISAARLCHVHWGGSGVLTPTTLWLVELQKPDTTMRAIYRGSPMKMETSLVESLWLRVRW